MSFGFSSSNDGDDKTDTSLRTAVQDFNLKTRGLEEQFPEYRITSALRKRLLLEKSQHPLGLAKDYAVPPDRAQAFMLAATARGLVAVDELTREKAIAHGSKDWTGPHIHVQAFPKGKTPASFFDETP